MRAVLILRDRVIWARLIRKVYEVDPLLCLRCGGTMKVVAVIERPAVVRQIRSAELATKPRPPGLTAAPPSFRAPPDPPDGLPADPPREWSYELLG